METNPFVDRIRAALAEHNKTQVQAAAELGITPQAFQCGIQARRLRRVREYMVRLTGRPESDFWPPRKKPGPRPKNLTTN